MLYIPPKLEEIIQDFAICEGSEKVELLLEFSERMPTLPDYLQKNHTEMDFVQECMTPVYVAAEIENGKMRFHFDVPAESPTVRGFAGILSAGLDGSTPQEILDVPNDFFYTMGLERVLTMQRLNGLSAILAHMKRLAVAALES